MKLNLKSILLISIMLLYTAYSNAHVICNDSLSVIQAYWGELNKPIEVEPGDKGVPLTIIIRNEKMNTITNIVGELFLKQPFSGLESHSSITSYYVGAVQPGGTFHLTFYLSIDENAILGYYNLQLKIDFSEIIRGSQQSGECSLTVKVPLLGKADIVFSINRMFVQAGVTSELKLYIINRGTAEALNLKVKMETQGQISILNNTEVEVNVLGLSKIIEIPIKIYVPKQSAGSKASIIISTSYTTVYGFTRNFASQITINIPSTASSTVKLDVNIDRYMIIGGSLNNVVGIKIRNEGEVTVKSLTITITLPSNIAILGSDNTWFLGEIKPNQEIEIPVRIYAPKEAVGISFQATIELKYRDENELEWIETRKIGFTVIGYIDLQLVSLAISPSQIQVGEKLTISGSIRNDGIAEARGIKITVSSEDDILEEMGEKTIYIGSLSSGSQAPFSVSFNIKDSTPPGKYILRITASYKDELEKKYTVTWPVNITVIQKMPERPEGKGLGPEFSLQLVIMFSIVSFMLGSILTFLIYRKVSRPSNLGIGVEK